MANPPELWTFAIANLVAVGLGTIMTGLSFYAYYVRQRRRSFRDATAGFGVLTLGMAIEPFYQLGIREGTTPGGRELLALQTVEAVLLGIGFGLLFYSIYRHDSDRQQRYTKVVQTSEESKDETRG